SRCFHSDAFTNGEQDTYPTRRSSDLAEGCMAPGGVRAQAPLRLAEEEGAEADEPVPATNHPGRGAHPPIRLPPRRRAVREAPERSEEHTSELQSRENLVCRLLLEKKK